MCVVCVVCMYVCVWCGVYVCFSSTFPPMFRRLIGRYLDGSIMFSLRVLLLELFLLSSTILGSFLLLGMCVCVYGVCVWCVCV